MKIATNRWHTCVSRISPHDSY